MRDGWILESAEECAAVLATPGVHVLAVCPWLDPGLDAARLAGLIPDAEVWFGAFGARRALSRRGHCCKPADASW